MRTSLGLALLILFVYPALTFGLQTHEAPEGFVAHQLAHLFFFGAMLFFAHRLKRAGLTRQPHWNFIRWGAVLLGLWNIWAFSGHLIERHLSESLFIGGPGGATTHYCQKRLLIRGWEELAYFVLKNDNLLTVPAFYLFYRGLQRLTRLLREGL